MLLSFDWSRESPNRIAIMKVYEFRDPYVHTYNMVCIFMFIQLFFRKNAALMLLVGGIIVERTATELFDILGLRFYHSVF